MLVRVSLRLHGVIALSRGVILSLLLAAHIVRQRPTSYIGKFPQETAKLETRDPIWMAQFEGLYEYIREPVSKECKKLEPYTQNEKTLFRSIQRLVVKLARKMASIACIVTYCWTGIFESCRVTGLRYPSWKYTRKSQNFTLSLGTFPQNRPRQ